MASFDDFTRRFSRDIDNAIDKSFDSSYLREVGSQIVNQIQVRTRSGFGVARNDTRQTRLRALSTNYIELRRFARSVGLLANTTTPGRSNLTFTGNMLGSIRYRVEKRSINFSFSNQEAEETAEEVQVRRPFFNLSSTEIRNLARQFNRRLRTFLTRV